MKYFLILLLLVFVGCTDAESTITTLESAGYSNIETGDYAFFACGGDDTFHTKFTATNPVGKRVSGVVCCGLFFKACTIRF